MMYPRLFLARQLLRDDGTIFISIDDNEVHNLRMLMNEVFGEENFLATVVWEKVYAPKPAAKTFSSSHDYLVVYSKNIGMWERFLLPRTKEQDNRYQNPDEDPRGPWASDNLLRNEHRDNSVYTIVSPVTGKEWTPRRGTSWRHPEDEMRRLIENNEIWFGHDGNGMPRRKKFLKDVQSGLVPQTLWSYREVGHTQDAKRQIIELFGYDAFDTPKPSSLIKQAARITTAGEDIVLDFFSGSSATAQAVLELNREDEGNRRFILVQLPEPTDNDEFFTIAEIGKERIRRVISKMRTADEGMLPLYNDEDLGFKVFKMALSNMRLWTGLFTDPLVEGWEVENVIYEVARREGFGLNCTIEEVDLEMDNTIYRVTDPDKEQFFHICLDSRVSPDYTYEGRT